MSKLALEAPEVSEVRVVQVGLAVGQCDGIDGPAAGGRGPARRRMNPKADTERGAPGWKRQAAPALTTPRRRRLRRLRRRRATAPAARPTRSRTGLRARACRFPATRSG